MAKRVFEIANELGVQSKAIVVKCQAEGIPKIDNHMSSVSAGLEATIREWFASAAAGSAHNTVETAAPVDFAQVRASPKARAKSKGKKADDADQPSTPDGIETETATAIAEPPVAPPRPRIRPSEPEAAPSAPPIIAPPAPVAPPSSPVRTVTDAPLAPHTPATRKIVPPAPPKAPNEEDGGAAPRERPAAEPLRPAARGPTHSPRMNVPARPTVVSPVGPKLEVQAPPKLSGPRVIRVETPEALESPRPARRPSPDIVTSQPTGRGGRGAGGGGGGTTAEEEARSRRNKRRVGAPGGAPPSRRSGQAETEPSGGWSAQDLIEREARLTRSGGFLRQRRRDAKLKSQAVPERFAAAAQTGGVVRIPAPFSIKDLSAATGVKAAEIVKKLFMKGIMATANSGIDVEQAQEVMLDFNIELEAVEAKGATDAVIEESRGREAIDVHPRSPVVTILGHVDHGKTTLLDKVRNTNIAESEAGGITQSTRAFRVPVRLGEESKHICFLDTPGHQAFSEMRARGANMTDIVVLVVSAVDGVMPQTIESMNHAKAAKVPIVVALNKIDLPQVSDSLTQQILGRLAEHGFNPTEWGGSTEVIRTSGVTGTGVQQLLETLDYQAQLLELKADFGGTARGAVIEARMVEGRGPVANLLIQEGELKVGDVIVAGRGFGRVRDITSDRGERIESAGPSTPVLVSGLDELPDAGDRFYIVESLRLAQDAAEQRRRQERERELATPKVTLESMFAQLKESEIKELRIVLKADVQGSVDVIKKTIEEVSTEDIKVRVLHAGVGGINESDVALAEASRAVVLGFNVIPSGKARQGAEQRGVQIRTYQVIYDIVDDVKRAAEGLLEPEVREEVLGHAEVRKVFKVTKVGSIAGCYITDGTVERNALIRVTRGGVVVEHDRVLEQLRRVKDDVRDVRAGQECGMKIVGYDDIKEGDVLECYRKVEVRRSLTPTR